MKSKYFLYALACILSIYLILFFIYESHFTRGVVLSPVTAQNSAPCKETTADDKSTVRVLVVDGGGVDGIIPLLLLEHLEEKTGKPISELFDYYTGTSTGSIIVSLLNIPDKNGKPLYSAKDIKYLYTNVSKDALNPSLVRRLFTINGILRPHLSIEKLNHGFKQILNKNNVTYGSLLNRVSITAFNIEQKKLTLLNNWECKNSVSRYLVSDIVSAAVATPAFFAPVELKDFNGDRSEVFIDGMIFDNNPSLVAVNEAFKIYPNAKKFVIVHLGTGGDSLDYIHLSADKKNAWGMMRWIFPMLTLLYKSQNSSIEHAIIGIQNFSSSTKFKYNYFNKNLKKASPFDTSDKNLQKVISVGEELLKEQKPELDKVAKHLLSES